jgi:hypothetical protein
VFDDVKNPKSVKVPIASTIATLFEPFDTPTLSVLSGDGCAPGGNLCCF